MKKVYLAVFALVFLHVCYAQSGISLISFSSGYSSPLGIENCGDSRLFIVQKGGQIFICDTLGKRTATPFLDIKDRITATSSEQGLLGLAFNPNYKRNGYFYVDYINKSGNTQISRFKVSSSNPNQADISSEKLILQITQPAFTNHKGGCIRFGKDGFLYIATGDGGSGGDPFNNAQNPASLLGKILRINVNTDPAAYGIPASNPFVDSANYKKEILALGVRNPWRFSFDAGSASLIIADVGQDAWEEVNLQFAKSKGGENYGWRCYEGNHAYNTTGCAPQASYKSPIYEYPHSSVTGDCSITGGFVYRGKKFPALKGKYFFTDYCSGIIKTLTLQNGAASEADVYKGDQYAYTSFGEDRNNELYVTNYVNGGIYRIAGTSALTATDIASSAQMTLYPNPAHQNFSIQYTTAKAEECVIAVYAPNGRKVYTNTKLSVAGNNVWNIKLLSAISGNCYVTVASTSGLFLRQTIVIR